MLQNPGNRLVDLVLGLLIFSELVCEPGARPSKWQFVSPSKSSFSYLKQDMRMSVHKERLHHPSPSGFNTVDLWALMAAKLQSPTELHAYFRCPPLDHMEHEGHWDTVYHRFVCLCEHVRVQDRV